MTTSKAISGQLRQGDKVVVTKSRKLGDNVEAVVISGPKRFSSDSRILEWSYKVEANGTTCWIKQDRLLA